MSLLIFLGLVAAVAFWLVSVFNGLVSLRQRGKQAFSDVNVQLKQRHDLVPNLVETVKGYATHEKSTLDDVVKARNAAVTAQGPVQRGGRGRADRRAFAADRAVGSLSGSEGEPEFPAAAERVV